MAKEDLIELTGIVDEVVAIIQCVGGRETVVKNVSCFAKRVDKTVQYCYNR